MPQQIKEALRSKPTKMRHQKLRKWPPRLRDRIIRLTSRDKRKGSTIEDCVVKKTKGTKVYLFSFVCQGFSQI